ncbi:unnamed protein product, partial [marine sediment metagenome]
IKAHGAHLTTSSDMKAKQPQQAYKYCFINVLPNNKQ